MDLIVTFDARQPDGSCYSDPDIAGIGVSPRLHLIDPALN